MKKQILWTALTTPLSPNGEVDFNSLKTLLKAQEESQNAILLLGSTGEGISLEEREKKKIIDFALDLNLSVPIMVGVGGQNIQDQINWVQYLNTLPIHALLTPTPLYTKPGEHGQYQWFSTLFDQSKHPCMVYNIPSRTGVKFHLGAMGRLKDHENFFALKDSSGSVDDFKAFGEVASSDEVALYCGDDGLLPSFSQEGARGLVSVASNVWPGATRLFAESCLNPETHSRDLNPFLQAIQALFLATNPIPTKALLAQKGMILSAKMRCPLDEKDLASVGPLIEADQEVNKWYERSQN